MAERWIQYGVEFLFSIVVLLLVHTLVFDGNWVLTILSTAFFWMLYRFLCREYLFGSPQFLSTGVMRLAEMGDLATLQRDISKGTISVHQKDNEQRTLLHWAARRNQTEVCEYLIRNGIDIDSTDKDGQTALHLAARFDRLAAARLLVEFGANKEVRNTESKTAADVATTNPMKILLQMPLFQNSRTARGGRPISSV